MIPNHTLFRKQSDLAYAAMRHCHSASQPQFHAGRDGISKNGRPCAVRAAKAHLVAHVHFMPYFLNTT